MRFDCLLCLLCLMMVIFMYAQSVYGNGPSINLQELVDRVANIERENANLREKLAELEQRLSSAECGAIRLRDEMHEVGVYVNSAGNSWGKCHPYLKIDSSNLTVWRHKQRNDASSSLTLSPSPSSHRNELVQAKWGQRVPGLFTYFEVAIIKGNCFSIGVAPSLNAGFDANLCQFPGAYVFTSDGHLCRNGQEQILGDESQSAADVAYGESDVVGFGYNANDFFGTKNGKLIWTHSDYLRLATNDPKLLPTINFCGFGKALIRANFGEQQFQFDTVKHIILHQ